MCMLKTALPYMRVLLKVQDTYWNCLVPTGARQSFVNVFAYAQKAT